MAPRWGEGKKTIDGVISTWWEEEGVKSLDHEQWNHQKKRKEKKRKNSLGGFFIYIFIIFLT